MAAKKKTNKKPKSAERSPSVPAKVFIQAWQTSSNVKEVMEKTGIRRPATATSRAVSMRKRGIPLKKYSTGGAESNEDLADYARSLVEDSSGEAEPEAPEETPRPEAPSTEVVLDI